MENNKFIENLIMDQMKEIKEDIKDTKENVHDIKVTLSAWEEKFVTKDQVIKVLAWIICTIIAVAGVYFTFKQIQP